MTVEVVWRATMKVKVVWRIVVTVIVGDVRTLLSREGGLYSKVIL